MRRISISLKCSTRRCWSFWGEFDRLRSYWVIFTVGEPGSSQFIPCRRIFYRPETHPFQRNRQLSFGITALTKSVRTSENLLYFPALRQVGKVFRHGVQR